MIIADRIIHLSIGIQIPAIYEGPWVREARWCLSSGIVNRAFTVWDGSKSRQ